MKNIIITAVSSALVISILFACAAKNEKTEAVAIDKEAIKREIQAKEDSFASLYNTGQLRDIGYYADDAVSYFQNRPPLVGKAAIVSFLKDDLISNTNKISFKSNDLFISNDGNMVVEIGAFTVVDSANNVLNSGNYMSLFEKRNGKYVAVRDMSASDMPFR